MHLDQEYRNVKVMGESGGFGYASEPEPAVTTDQILDFYERCNVDYGLSVDHVIAGFLSPNPRLRERRVTEDWLFRRELTIALAEQFYNAHKAGGYSYTPIGVAQGWSPGSYAKSVMSLQKIGYEYIAIGGLAPLAHNYILQSLAEIKKIRHPSTKLHLLGISRPNKIRALHNYGVKSFDTSTPLRQAFLNERHNYYTDKRTFLAIRLPQVNKNRHLREQIADGRIRAREAYMKEQDALNVLRRFDKGQSSITEALDKITTYELLFNNRDHRSQYEEVLKSKPWKDCTCTACKTLGIEIMLLRGKQRNNRRGFHNLKVFFGQLTKINVANHNA